MPAPWDRAMSLATEHADGIVIDEHLAAMVPPLTPAEQAGLEQRLLSQGCTEPMVVWHQVLIDGHHALPICRAHRIPFTVIACSFTDRSEVEAYIAEMQLSRRGIAPGAASYLRGKRYLAEKDSHGGDRRSRSRFQHETLRTRERLAVEYRVSAATIARDAEFAATVDAIAANCGPLAVRAIVPRAGELGRDRIRLLAHRSPRDQQRLCRILLAGGDVPELDAPRGRETLNVQFDTPLKPELVARRLLDQMTKATGVAAALHLLFLAGLPEEAVARIAASLQTAWNPCVENRSDERQA
jgi:hypothetical protein